MTLLANRIFSWMTIMVMHVQCVLFPLVPYKGHLPFHCRSSGCWSACLLHSIKRPFRRSRSMESSSLTAMRPCSRTTWASPPSYIGWGSSRSSPVAIAPRVYWTGVIHTPEDSCPEVDLCGWLPFFFWFFFLIFFSNLCRSGKETHRHNSATTHDCVFCLRYPQLYILYYCLSYYPYNIYMFIVTHVCIHLYGYCTKHLIDK